MESWHKTVECFSEEVLLHYATGTVTPESRQALEEHLAACLYCRQRAANVYRMAETARQAMCLVITPQLSAYLDGRLNHQERTHAQAHLRLCEECLARYDEIVSASMEKEWAEWVDEERSSVVPKGVELLLGRLCNFPALRPQWIPTVQAVRLAAQTHEAAIQEVNDWQEFTQEGITATLALDPQDHLLVALESTRYDVSHATVSLCAQTEAGPKTMCAVLTDQDGQADFGPIDAIPKPEHEEYHLMITGLSELAPASVEHHTLTLDAFKKAQAFFQEHRESLLTEYEGKYIAIIDNRVIDVDADFSALADRVYAQYGYGAIYMPRVTREQEMFSIPTPRLGQTPREQAE
jgi:hypothetical protein